MNIIYPGFGEIVVEGNVYDHDIVIEDGTVRPRDKKPSKPLESQHGHTPLSASEDIPWSKPRLIIGSGYSGRLPVLPEVRETAREREVELIVVSTAEACAMLSDEEKTDVNAVLHVTC
ncbi:MAG: MTH938/NDUFAF3 family protein [Acidimicrobiia bacterium]|jgi:hypothetical protein